MDSKVCTGCGKTLPLVDFRADRRRKSGVASVCKQCRNDRDRSRRYAEKGLNEWGFPAVSDEERERRRDEERERRAAKDRADREAARRLKRPAGWKPEWVKRWEEERKRAAEPPPPPVTPKKHQPKPKPKSKLEVVEPEKPERDPFDESAPGWHAWPDSQC